MYIESEFMLLEANNEEQARVIKKLRAALRDWHDMFEWGDFSLDFSNGITYNGVEEGRVKGNAMLMRMREQTRQALMPEECTCLPDLPDGRGRGHCPVCEADKIYIGGE